jgi:hypothetical protein
MAIYNDSERHANKRHQSIVTNLANQSIHIGERNIGWEQPKLVRGREPKEARLGFQLYRIRERER